MTIAPRTRRLLLPLVGLVSLVSLACSSTTTAGHDGNADATADANTDGNSDGARDGERGDGERSDAVYPDGDGGMCTPGVPRCQGDFGYQMCDQSGTWSESHSCAGYSSNGTSSYCAEIPMQTGQTWATCVDPACWYWIKNGFLPGSTPVGVCLPDGTLNRCSAGGTLSVTACQGVCTQVGMLDGRALGFCTPECEDGARECLGGPFYRTCAKGRWLEQPAVCDTECNPVAKSATGSGKPDIRCEGPCDPGTSRCQGSGIELCTDARIWKSDRTCALGLCRPAGPQAECQAECTQGQHQCAFDGAASERSCQDNYLWSLDTPCPAGTTCRMSGSLALGCVTCVSARPGGGNGYGFADSRCVDQTVEECGPDNQWHSKKDCTNGALCANLTQGPSSVAACPGPPQP